MVRTWKRPTPVALLLAFICFMALTMVLGGPRRATADVRAQTATTILGGTPPTAAVTAAAVTTATAPASTKPTVRSASPTTARAPVATTVARAATPPPVVARPSNGPTTSIPPTTSTVPAPTTTILAIGQRLPKSASTFQLQTTSSNGHVNLVFAWLSGVGFAIALLIVATRLFLTRPGGKDRAPIA